MDVCGIFLLALLVSIHNILSTHKEISFFFGWSPVALSLPLFFCILTLSPNNNSSFFSVCIIYISICAFIFCNNYKYSIHLFSNTLIHETSSHIKWAFFFVSLCFHTILAFAVCFFSFLSLFCFALNSLFLSLFWTVYLCLCVCVWVCIIISDLFLCYVISWKNSVSVHCVLFFSAPFLFHDTFFLYFLSISVYYFDREWRILTTKYSSECCELCCAVLCVCICFVRLFVVVVYRLVANYFIAPTMSIFK